VSSAAMLVREQSCQVRYLLSKSVLAPTGVVVYYPVPLLEKTFMVPASALGLTQ